VGLENGDLLFLGLFKATDLEHASSTLRCCFRQVLLPIQHIIQQTIASSAESSSIIYAGIDASLNPGITLPESIGNAIEQTFPNKFGSMGTLSVVSCITAAIKSINEGITDAHHVVRLCGYGGLMLPVMEDIVLAARADDQSYTIRDLLLFSNVCGVGVDTVHFIVLHFVMTF